LLRPYGHYTFWVKLKFHFLALSLFKYCKISFPFVIEKDELSVLFLNYTGFSSKHKFMRVLWRFIINFLLTYKVVQIWPGLMSLDLHTNSTGHIWTSLYFKIVYIYKLNFNFYKSRFRKRHSVDILSHLHICFKNINFSKSTLSVAQILLKSQTQYLIRIFLFGI